MSDALKTDIDAQALSIEQCLSVLARGARAQLIDLVGDDPSMRLVAMSAFLYFVCQKPREPAKLANILRALADQVESEAASDPKAGEG